ncbi:hypothetical protein X474_04485 [Dethiosulfatarculus sandiegensis]|uniref:Uncharacterized protein n=1 Tax=Dethiosulfatarculus sandiegensis TaxID=1429043 RepID=A0A0D2HZ16_9BACT|nr:hypothetical protein X474_04485 [Dethiosulfatarculus sandiegensis]
MLFGAAFPVDIRGVVDSGHWWYRFKSFSNNNDVIPKRGLNLPLTLSWGKLFEWRLK